MVNRSLIRSLERDQEIDNLFQSAVSEIEDPSDIINLIDTETEFDANRIVDGRVVRVDDESVLVDVGFKSEATIPLDEWDSHEDPPVVGDTTKVLIEELEDELGLADDPHGMISLSRRRALKLIKWDEIIDSVQEGQVVTGTVTRKIKGGLLVDIGLNVFLPASQVDVRRPSDIGDYIGRCVQCEIMKIDEARRNIVVSRRLLIERQRKEDRERLLEVLVEGEIRKGVVKNVTSFGAFVDLGGIDGLLHITDMSWDRIDHPSAMVSLDQEIHVVILRVDREKERIALGLKQKQANPWDNVEEKYAEGTTHHGTVVNVLSYGAFVKLEPGIEGLLHISEMSWTKHIKHPSELVHIGDEIDLVILKIDREGQQLSLGMKQTQDNPWDRVGERYTEGSTVTGEVRNLTNYGAFVELEAGIDGLLHVSDMSWTRKISHPNEVVEKGQEVTCRVLSVDQERRRIALGLRQMDEDPWAEHIPNKYQPGQVISGNVKKITNFGVFVGLEDGLEGLLHVSELADHKVENPEEVVEVGEEVEVKILRIDIEERKIGLSRRRVEWAEEDAAAQAKSPPGKEPSAPLKGGLGASGPLIQPIVPSPEEAASSDPSEDSSSTEETD